MSPISLLAQIVAQKAKLSTASFRAMREYRSLLEAGYVRESGVVASLPCGECSEAHDAELVFQDGQYGYFCPEIGFVRVERERVQAASPDIPKLVEALADAFQCKRRKSTALQGATWRIGAVETDQGDVMLFFRPTLRDEDDLRALNDALSREMRSAWRLIVTAEGTLPIQGTASVTLGELVDLGNTGGQLVPLSDPCTLAGVPSRNPGGAPNRFGSLLSDLLAARIQNGEALSGRNEEAKAVLALF